MVSPSIRNPSPWPRQSSSNPSSMKPPSWRTPSTRPSRRAAAIRSTRCATLIVANGMLERELADVYAKASQGFLRGRRLPKRT
ncbi:hypothetical protein AB7008_41290 [Bradyrhizobium sp. 521_C7_N1_3]|uniref:hypothetical protein n=1 Tax=Bradyrhizobium sp. 521_C7_N1_3 TaxID=3240368 RepID=UPI003F8893A3